MHVCRFRIAPSWAPVNIPYSQYGVVCVIYMCGVGVGLVKVVPSIVKFCHGFKQSKPKVQTLKEGLIGVPYKHLSHYILLIRHKGYYSTLETYLTCILLF